MVAPVAAIAALEVIAVIVGVAIWAGLQVQVAVMALALIFVLLSFRWPLLPLFALAVLIPFEVAARIGDAGTASRYAAVLFIVAYGVPRLGRLNIRAMPLAGWGFVAWAAFSASWAIDSAQSWTQITPLILLIPVATLMASVVVDRPAIVRPLLWAYSLSAALTALLAILPYVIAGEVVGPSDRAAGLVGQDPAHFAAILVPALVFGFHELLGARWLLPSAMVTLVCTAGIMISGTRGAWLSVVIVVAVFILPRLEPIRRVAAVSMLLALLVVTLQIPGIADLIGGRADSALSSGGAGRTSIWSVGLGVFGTAPLAGVGLANFPVANTPERVRDVQILLGEGPSNLEAHNIVISTLAELGLVGIVLLGLFLVPLVVRRGWGPDGAMIQAALASLLVMALFLDVLVKKELWFFIGLACGLSYLARREASREDSRVETPGAEESMIGMPPATDGSLGHGGSVS